MKTIKIGIIGAGRIGRVHAENIAKFVPEMEIKTIADPYMSEETVEFLRCLRIPNIVKDAEEILNTPSRRPRPGRTCLWRSPWTTASSG